METLPVQRVEHKITTQGTVGVEDLLRAWLAGRSAKTVEAYRRDLEHFASWIGATNIDEAARGLLNLSHGQANHVALSYRNRMRDEEQLSTATVNRRMSSLRSLVSLAKTLGIVSWTLSIPNLKSRALRDTRGCGLDGVRKLLAVARKQRSRFKAVRDVALLRLLFDLGLRRAEVLNLRMQDVDLDGSRVHVLGKGHTERSPMTLPDPTREAIRDWLEVRGTEAGFLFINAKGYGDRLSDNGLYRLVRHLGRKAGVKASPHRLRHAAVTGVLDLTDGNVRVAQRFARHASPETTLRYDDNRRDEGGEAAKRLADEV
jgi:integrase/recombinase XerC